MIAILTFLLTLSIVVLMHEFGHFWTARRAGVTVHEFGFGFPPRLFGFRRGATEFSFNLVPFGGFVRMEGENEDVGAPGSFRAVSVSRRTAILLAGVVMNLVLAVGLFTLAYSVGVPTEVDPANVPAGVRDLHVTIITVQNGSPAKTVGLEVSDRLIGLNGAPLTSIDQIRQRVEQDPDKPLTLSLKRGRTTQTVTVVPEAVDGGQPRIGISGTTVGTYAVAFPRSFLKAAQFTGELTLAVFQALGNWVRDLVVQHRLSNDLSGPIGIAVLSGQVSAVGFAAVLQFIGALSVSLAVLNVLPLPLLDGGRVLFTLLEGARRKPVPEAIERRFHTYGLYALLALVIVISIKDVRQFGVLDRIRTLLP